MKMKGEHQVLVSRRRVGAAVRVCAESKSKSCKVTPRNLGSVTTKLRLQLHDSLRTPANPHVVMTSLVLCRHVKLVSMSDRSGKKLR